MTDLIAWLVAHGYPIIFLMLLGSGLGVPVPEDVPLIAAGVLADHGGLPVPLAGLACAVFVLARDGIVFMLGRRFGTDVLENRWAQRMVPVRTVQRAERHLKERGALVVFVGRFLPGLRAGVFFAAGASGVPPRTFFLTDGLAVLISVPFFVWLGFAFSQNLPRIHALVVGFREVSLGVAAVLLVLWLWRIKRGQRDEGPAEPGADASSSP